MQRPADHSMLLVASHVADQHHHPVTGQQPHPHILTASAQKFCHKQQQHVDNMEQCAYGCSQHDLIVSGRLLGMCIDNTFIACLPRQDKPQL